MSAHSLLRQAMQQINFICEDIELDLDEGLDHKGAYMASVVMELRTRVDALLSDRESEDWDLSEDDIVDKRLEKVADREGVSVDTYLAMRAADEDRREERGL